jgi:hypothetical protein
VKTTLETSGEDVKTTPETSGEDVKTTLETSGEDVKTTLERRSIHPVFGVSFLKISKPSFWTCVP